MSKVLRSLKNDNPIGIVIPFMSNRMDCTEEGRKPLFPRVGVVDGFSYGQD